MQIDAKEFLFSLPVKANPEALEGLSTCFHFEISDSGSYTVNLVDGKLDVSEGLTGDPKCAVKTSAESFSKLIQGDLNPMMAIMTGKIKISNPGEMLKYAKIFGLM
jgi:putative sterol carrier protein